MNWIIRQAIVSALLFSAGADCAAQQRKADTLVTVRFPAQTMQVRVPVQYVVETVYVCPPTVIPMAWSSYTGSFQSFVDDAAKLGRVAYIDKDVAPAKTVMVPSGLQLKADTNATIRNQAGVLFRLHNATGSQLFEGLRIVQDSGGTAFERITSGVAFYDSLHNVQVTGGEAAYSSSRGGTASKMAVTAMRNCRFDVRYIALSAFSQDGPWRALHLYNVQMKTSYSHNLYVHPSTSLYYDSVACIGAGKLMQHQYSGSGNGGYNTGRYSIFKRVYGNGRAFEMTTLAEGPVIIEDSKIGPYVTAGVLPAMVYAKNTEFVNAGNGIFLRGTIEHCTGGAWTMEGDTLRIINSKLSELCFRSGGVAIVQRSSIANMWGADRAVRATATITLQDSQVGSYWGMGLIPVSVNIQRGSVGRYGGTAPIIIQ